MLVVPVRCPPLKYVFLFLETVKFFFPPLSISILYITTHLYKVFKFIYKNVYIFFCVPFWPLFLFVCFSVRNPDAAKWTFIVALRISSINTSCFKSHYVKQDLNVSEGMLALLSEHPWEPPSLPFWTPSQMPCALRNMDLPCAKLYVPKLSVTFAFFLFFDAVLFVHHVLLWCYIGRFVCSFNVTYNKMCLVADCPESILNEEV